MNKEILGFKRILAAFNYSLSGLKHAASRELAFQQELIFLAIMSIVAMFMPFSMLEKILIMIAHVFILLIELLNSAIEAVVDKASPEKHELAKQSKDMASAAVMLAFIIAFILWTYAIIF